MKIWPVDSADIPLRAKPTGNFFWADNELVDLFLPLIEAEAMSVYIVLARRHYVGEALGFTTRELAKAVGCSPATVSRALEVLHYIGMVRVRYSGGNQPSKCDLIDLKALALHLGATPNRYGNSFAFPDDVRIHLRHEITALKAKRSGTRPASSAESPSEPSTAAVACENPVPCVSQRNASASPEKRQRVTSETQNGSHLLLQDTRHQDYLSPTPFRECEGVEKQKPLPDKGGTDADLHWARAKFNGVMSDMKNHLFAPRPPLKQLANGFDDWQRFDFDSLSVVRASWRGTGLVLILSASDPAAARRGFEKYSGKWEASLREWYGCEVEAELFDSRSQRETDCDSQKASRG